MFFLWRENNRTSIHVKLFTFRVVQVRRNGNSAYTRRTRILDSVADAVRCSATRAVLLTLAMWEYIVHTVRCAANNHTDTQKRKRLRLWSARSRSAESIKAEWMRANDTIFIFGCSTAMYAVIVWPPYNFICVLYKTHCIPSTGCTHTATYYV